MDPVPLFWKPVIHAMYEMSGLNFNDYVHLVGHYHKILVGSKGDKELRSRGYSEEVLKEIEKQKRKSFGAFESLNLSFKIPLDNFQSDIINYCLFLFHNYEKGLLPFPGTVSEQPAQIMEIFNILESLKFEQEEKTRKKIENDGRLKSKDKRRTSR